jgi:ATPase subunit of ABC transporter with duplicated ATPase domains
VHFVRSSFEGHIEEKHGMPQDMDGGVEEDADVGAERARVCSGDAAHTDSLRLVNLRKVYDGNPPKVAVNDLCLGVRHGERFGLLGPNGAGGPSICSHLPDVLIFLRKSLHAE